MFVPLILDPENHFRRESESPRVRNMHNLTRYALVNVFDV